MIFVGTARWISGCMLFFTEIIKPIEWIHPLISSLPYDKLDILESPTPILASMLGHDEVTSDHPITSVHELMDGTCIIQNI